MESFVDRKVASTESLDPAGRMKGVQGQVIAIKESSFLRWGSFAAPVNIYIVTQYLTYNYPIIGL